ncbi:RRP12-like protein isoform X2 [Panicum miliaceum]|uniref:RRP12-like protein isoform X2 n=1 Tax=Panicum miliaceum TaxID=4540 RepID=A0A3L6RPM1_PANMI|nr:RRP12-like protein isoform X2 [Panicum miliaceum]
MADVDMAELPQTPRSTAGDDDLSLLDGEADLAAAILERLGGSPREDFQHLCATAAAMAQAVRDRGFEPTPVAYFAAAAAALAPLTRAGPGGADRHVAGALLAFLSAALPALPAAVVRARGREVADDVVRVLEFPSTPDSGVRAGLRCLAHLISAGDRANWEAVEPLYSVILRLATDHRPKVRKQAHSCLRDVLQSFQRQAILVPASEGITRCFERFLLLAGGSSAVNTGVAEEGPKGAKEVLYMLNGLKCCLPLMASKPSNTILKYFKPLLDLQQPILTRSILEILNAVGESPALQLKSDVLLDVMCSLGLSVSSGRKSGDEMASIARLLHVGTKKIYNKNKNICVVKLPLIFTSLGDILSSEFEEARFSSVEAFRGLIDNCIDETMVSQGIAQIKARRQGLKSDPTVIEKICAILEGLLDVRYIDLNTCIGSAVAAMGPKNVLEILEIRSLCAENEWILPILEKHIVGASLQFFLKDVLGFVKAIEKSITKLLKDDKLFSAKRAEGYVYSLWSLLPSCCNYPCDTSSNFGVLQSVLCDTLQNQPELRGIVCSSIQVLIKQNKEALSVSREEDILSEDELSKSEIRAKERYTKKLAEENLKAIRAFSSKLLDVLCSIFLTSSKDAIGLLQPAISEIASISDKDVVGKFFLDSIRKLLDATKAVNAEPVDDSSMQIETNSNTNSMTRALLLDFAASLMPGLAAKSINVLFSYVKPAIKDSDALIQKRAYKVLSMLLKDAEFVEKNLDVLLELMISSMPCQFPSKRYRLECLYHLIVHILKDSSMVRKRDIISSFITEILLALKEANKKTRNRAYDLLIEIARACEDAGNDERKDSLHQFFGMVAGGLVSGQTPYAISAVVTGLARLTYEFSELIGIAYKLLPQTFLLMQRNNREIVKANLGFVKALVARSKADMLHEHLKGVVEGLLSWQSDTKSSFKAKVKSLIEILVKKCGLDAVKAVMPEEHMKLLTNIRKINERKMRKAKSSEDGDAMSMASGATRQSRWNHTQMFSDFGSDDDESDGPFSTQHTVTSRGGSKASTRLSRRRQADKSLLDKSIDQSTGEPLDLLDQKTVRLALKSGRKRTAPDDDEDDFEVDPEGRIIVQEERDKRKKKPVSRDNDDADGKSSVRSQSVKKRKTSSDWAYTGHEYTSKKAGGDLKKKDKMEPYAYWPLNRKLLNRRSDRKASARKGMASVMKATKKLEGKSASAALAAKRTGKMKHKKNK